MWSRSVDETRCYCCIISSVGTVWFLQLTVESQANTRVVDDYEHIVPEGVDYLKGHYLEKVDETIKVYKYQLMHKKSVFFYKESVVYPFVNFQATQKHLLLLKRDYVDMLYYLEQNGVATM